MLSPLGPSLVGTRTAAAERRRQAVQPSARADRAEKLTFSVVARSRREMRLHGNAFQSASAHFRRSTLTHIACPQDRPPAILLRCSGPVNKITERVPACACNHQRV